MYVVVRFDNTFMTCPQDQRLGERGGVIGGLIHNACYLAGSHLRLLLFSHLA
jgi:hypothetical protein